MAAPLPNKYSGHEPWFSALMAVKQWWPETPVFLAKQAVRPRAHRGCQRP